jgi:hypothetical protein
MLHLGHCKEAFVIIFAGLLSFFGKFGFHAFMHVVGDAGGPFDHLGISGKRRGMFRNDLQHSMIVHVGMFGVSKYEHLVTL